MKIVNLTQRSEEWHYWRLDKGMASEAACIMGESKWEPSTWYMLFLRKKSYIRDKVNEAMIHGTLTEPEAAACYVKNFGPIEPLCVEKEFNGLTLGASLDGMTTTDDLRHPLEIKCPKFGSLYKDLAVVKTQFVNDALPRNYYWQCQHILLVTGLPAMHFFVYKNNNFILKTVVEDTENQQKLLEKWIQFLTLLNTDEAPSLTFQDKRFRHDDDWQAAATKFKLAHREVVKATEAINAAKKKLLELADNEPSFGFGVRVNRSRKASTYTIPKEIKDKYKVDHDGQFIFRVERDTSDGK